MRGPRGLAVLLLAVAACGRCGGPVEAPERRVPAGSTAIAVPRLGDAARELRALLATAERFPALAGLPADAAALTVQLGFDPLDAKGLEAAGLDPRGGAALARTPGGELAVLPVADASRLDEALGRLARDRLGATQRARTHEGDVALTTYAAPGAPPALAVAVAGRLALVARGAGAAALAARAARLPEADALPGSAPWRAARGALPSRPTALFYAPPGAPSLESRFLLRDGAAVALAASESTLELTAAIVLSPPRLEAWRAVAAGGGTGGADDLSRLPVDAVLAARFAGEPAPALRRLLALLPTGARAKVAPLAEELAPLLAPGGVASIPLAPTFDVTAFSRTRAAAADDPFRFVHVALALRAKDADAARRALELLAARAPALGLGARVEEGALALSLGPAVLRAAARGDRLLVAGGDGRLEELARGGGFAPPVAADLARGGVAGAAAAPESLVRAARALPEAAFGSGPDRFVMRSITERVLDPASRLRGAALRVELLEGAVRITGRLEARPGAAGTP